MDQGKAESGHLFRLIGAISFTLRKHHSLKKLHADREGFNQNAQADLRHQCHSCPTCTTGVLVMGLILHRDQINQSKQSHGQKYKLASEVTFCNILKYSCIHLFQTTVIGVCTCCPVVIKLLPHFHFHKVKSKLIRWYIYTLFTLGFTLCRSDIFFCTHRPLYFTLFINAGFQITQLKHGAQNTETINGHLLNQNSSAIALQRGCDIPVVVTSLFFADFYKKMILALGGIEQCLNTPSLQCIE